MSLTVAHGAGARAVAWRESGLDEVAVRVGNKAWHTLPTPPDGDGGIRGMTVDAQGRVSLVTMETPRRSSCERTTRQLGGRICG